jgi:hypothetical protein
VYGPAQCLLRPLIPHCYGLKVRETQTATATATTATAATGTTATAAAVVRH